MANLCVYISICSYMSKEMFVEELKHIIQNFMPLSERLDARKYYSNTGSDFLNFLL